MSDVVWLAIALGACSTVGFLAGFVLGIIMIGEPDVLRRIERRDY